MFRLRCETRVKYIVIMVAMLSMLSGCAVTDQMFDNAADYAYDLAQSDDSYVKTIKSAKMLGYNFTYEKAFSNFFAHPKWKHFTSDDGVEVVEFTGDCTYDDQEVRALIQFQITDESNGYISWEATYLSLNNVSQPLLMLDGLFEKITEDMRS